jgi:hypothetical protein
MRDIWFPPYHRKLSSYDIPHCNNKQVNDTDAALYMEVTAAEGGYDA